MTMQQTNRDHETRITIIDSTPHAGGVVPASTSKALSLIQSQSMNPAYAKVITKEMLAIFTMEESRSYTEDEVEELRTEQAKAFQELVSTIASNLRLNMVRLGWLLIHGDSIGLPSYLDKASMRDWAEEMGIPSPVRNHAIALAKIMPYFEKMGFTERQLLDADMTIAKAKMISKMEQDTTRQINAIKERKAAQLFVTEVVPVEDEEEMEPYVEYLLEQGEDAAGEEEFLPYPQSPGTPTVPPIKAYAKLPEPLQEEVERDAVKEYKAVARSEITYILSLKPDHFQQEYERKQGTLVTPHFIVKNLQWNERHGSVTGTFSCEYSPLHAGALELGKYELYFYMQGHKGAISLRDLPEVLAQLIHETQEAEEDTRRY